MKNIRPFLFAFLAVLTFSLSSCDVIGDIFQAGAWTALIGVFLVVVLIAFLVRKMRR